VKAVLKRPSNAATIRTDLLAVLLAGPDATLPAAAQALDTKMGGALARAIASGIATAKAGSGTLVPAPKGVPAQAVVLIGLGDGERDDFEAAGRTLGKQAGEARAARAAVLIPDGTDAASSRALVEGTSYGAYRYLPHKAKDPQAAPALSELTLVGSGISSAEVARATATAIAVSAARDLVNAPSNHLTPSDMAARARRLAAEIPGLTCTVLDEKALRRMKAGALLAVAQGSAEPPRMIVMRYQPQGAVKGKKLLGLVGKAMTFDSGGISIKPSSHMEDMKMDMGGGAAVIEGAGLIARLGLALPFIAIVPSAENMPSGTAVKPGDVITAMNGKTIEVINTDAEGRLILADALTYAVREGATHIVDMATLTGAIVVAIGDVYAGLYGSDADWTDAVKAAGETTGDLCWHMPMHKGYDPLIRSKVADLSNSSNKREAGSVYAAQFLREFTDGKPWCHIDVAGTAMIGGAGTGFGVRLIAELAAGMAAKR
jgi:leucyl aminopeptidase